ncbi:hypothetical protein PO524_06665, partial [Klebsiella pneumoniae]
SGEYFGLAIKLHLTQLGVQLLGCSPLALTGPTESVRYGVAPEIYGRAAGLIPAEIGEPKVGR